MSHDQHIPTAALQEMLRRHQGPSRLPDAERIAQRIARHVTGEYEDDVVLVTALLREEGVAE